MATRDSGPYGRYGPPRTDEFRLGAPPGGYLPAAPPGPPWRRRRRIIIVAIGGPVVVLALAGAVVAGWYASRDPKPVTVRGTLTLNDTDPNTTNFSWGEGGDEDLACKGYGGYGDIAEGASVVIRDAKGKVIAVGSLRAGVATVDRSGGLAIGTACTFPFTVEKVPAGDFYGVEVNHRSAVMFSDRQVTAGPVALTLGS
jgi:hypothetical protein